MYGIVGVYGLSQSISIHPSWGQLCICQHRFGCGSESR